MPKITRKTGKRMVNKARVLFLFGLILFSLQSIAQVSFDSQEDLEKAANEFFDSGQYAKAKPLFSQLLSKDALDPNYNYRFGVCIMFTEADPLKPLPYIEGGASSRGVNKEAYYYLGKAYQFNYRFDDAIVAYEKGKAAGFTHETISLDRSIEECRNGKILYNGSIDFKPASDKEVLASEFYRPYDFRKLKGKVIPMPPNFKTKFDEKNLFGTVIYTPSNSEVLVYASYGEDGANAKDLYRVNRLPNGEWALPQRLPNTINTKYDEDYAFYDEESQTLFFASKGHNTMGGFDVFSSKFDADANTWSTPMNLQYPVNSPFDDFLYVSDPEGELAFFTSGRHVEEGKLRVFKTLLYDPSKVEVSVLEGTYEDLTDSVYNYAALTVYDPLNKEVVGKYRTNKVTGKYLLILPPRNDYTMDVGPKEADGFKFDLDVPKHESYESLGQNITYDTEDGQATITVTNYFDATGKPDSVKFVQTLSKQSVDERMVTMPDPTELLAARNQANAEKAKAEQQALAAEKAKKDSIAAAEALALKKQQEEEAAAKLAQEKEVQARLDSLKQEEEAKLAKLKEEAELAQKAKEDSIRAAEQAAALAQQKAAEEEAKKQEALAAEKAKAVEAARKDSIAQAEAVALKAKEDSIRAAEQAAALAQQKVAEEEAKKQEALAAEQAKAVEAARKDSIAQVEALALKAQEKAKQDSISQATEEAALAAELKAQEAELLNEEESAAERALALEAARKDSIAKADKLEMLQQQAAARRDSVAAAMALELKQKEEAIKAELAAKKREKEVADSLANVALVARLEKEKAAKDSIAEAEEQMAAQKAEEERLAAIDREVQLAMQKALKDSMIVDEAPEEVVQAEPKKGNTYSEILKEMAAKEAEILKQQKEAAKPEEKAVAEAEMEEVAVDETESTTAVEELKETETLSESELFLQTIAQLEQQQKEQEKLIAAENESRQKAKTNAVEKPATEAAKGAQPTAGDQPEMVLTDGTATTDSTTQKEVAKQVETVALKSDADPEDYLAALNEIEKTIEEEAASRPDKDYTLRTMDELNGKPKETVADPVLQAKIDADRKALEEHQRNAREKEEALKAQMERDRQVVDGVAEGLQDEFAEVEELLGMAKDESQPSVSEVTENEVEAVAPVAEVQTKPEPVIDEAEVAAIEEIIEESEAVVEQPAKPEPATPAPTVEPMADVKVEEPKSPTTPVTEEVDDALLDELAEIDGLTEPKEETPASEPVVAELPKEEPKVEQPAKPEVVEVVEPVVVETIELEVAPTAEPEPVAEQEVAPTPEPEPVAAEEVTPTSEPETKGLSEPVAASVGTVGTIPFMTAAKRDYSIGKQSYDKVKDPDMRRMIKRMRAEDVGRIAVLKNMKNEWVEAGKTTESLKEIKDNLRNQDVLENRSVASREEYIRPPYDKDNLRKRQGVYYQLELEIETSPVSETVSQAMTPENAISFAMPAFKIHSGHYTTLADAQADQKEFIGRGFNATRIVPYLNNEQVGLSDVLEIPFVD